MQNIEYQLFTDYAKGLCMAITNGFDALFCGVSMRGITLPSHTAMWLKILIFNMLNIFYIFARIFRKLIIKIQI